MCSAQADVRFAPNSGHVRCTSPCLLCAKHDDLANVVAGVCALFAKSSYDMLSWFGDDELDLHRQEQLRFNRYVVTGGMR